MDFEKVTLRPKEITLLGTTVTLEVFVGGLTKEEAESFAYFFKKISGGIECSPISTEKGYIVKAGCQLKGRESRY